MEQYNHRMTPGNRKKIQLAIDVFEKYVDVKALDEKMITFKPEGITPHMFQYQLTKWAKSEIKHIVLPEGNEDRILKAADPADRSKDCRAYIAW